MGIYFRYYSSLLLSILNLALPYDSQYEQPHFQQCCPIEFYAMTEMLYKYTVQYVNLFPQVVIKHLKCD